MVAYKNHDSVSLSYECLLLLRVEELAKKKGVKMARIAVSWSLKRVTAPVVGTTMANFRTRRRQLVREMLQMDVPSEH